MNNNDKSYSWDTLIQADRVHRDVYTDEDLFGLEMDRVFGRTWVFLAHESEIPNPNDYRKAWIGRREVIVARGEEGEINVFVNRCSHRGATVCREHKGNSSSFTCPYHGWKFDNQGNLFGIPGKDAYGPTFKSRDMNLGRPAKTESYKGFIFATLDRKAKPLVSHLGSARQYIDQWIEHQGGAENILVSGAHRFQLECNWKLVYDNAGDGYHVPFSHQSLLVMTNERYGGGDMSYFADADSSSMFNYGLDNGHTLIDQRPDMFAVSAWKQQRPQPGREPFVEALTRKYGDAEAKAILETTVGAGMNLNIFPNLLLIGNQIQVITPISVGKVAVSFYATRRKDRDEDVNTMRLRTQEDFPVVGEMDDAANFEECYQGLLRNPEEQWVDMSRHLETGKDHAIGEGVAAGPVTSDIHMRTYYAEWKRLMSQAYDQSNAKE